MAKKLVTEDDLLSGVGGGFGTISQMGAGRPVRDNPFRDTRSDQTPTAPSNLAPAAEPKAAEPEPSPVPTKTVATMTRAPGAQPREASPSATPVRTGVKTRAPQRVRKTDTYSEKMSTFLSPEMRDELEMAARLLQRNRLVKGESITVHTLIRSGVRVMTELLQFTDADAVSSEEELDALVRRKLGM